ncbi:jerky protein homolog-like [Sitophilus oryzae]|uniref:Jerky protein homolog-like n=1 Tax=Sitophilus oryzae TaxID=7048 RepID=A0A6J2YPB9_SITOR|nr:jerky protein homolog-like [Sitophilus oryzae]
MISKQFPETHRFTGSSGWLDRWKPGRYGVRQLNICGEKLFADVSSIEKFKQDFKKLIKDCGYTCDQIYNCDESGLNYKMLPSNTLASRQEKSVPGHKRSKERLTIMACSNASGKHKITLMVIGKSAHPRALKDISPKALPVYYKSQKSAFVDATLFTNWFKEEFVPSVTKFLKRNGLPIKAILLMGNAPSHPGEGLHVGEIVVKFFLQM